jgi:hypothetical protein
MLLTGCNHLRYSGFAVPADYAWLWQAMQAVLDHNRLRQTTADYVSLRQTISVYSRLCQSTADYFSLQQSMSVYSRLFQSTAVYVSLQQSTTVYRRLRKVCHSAIQKIYLLYRLCHHCHLLHFATHPVQHCSRLRQMALILLMRG